MELLEESKEYRKNPKKYLAEQGIKLIKCLKCKTIYYKDITDKINNNYFCPICNKITKHKFIDG